MNNVLKMSQNGSLQNISSGAAIASLQAQAQAQLDAY